MTFTVSDVLDQLPETGTLSLAKLEKALGLTTKDKRRQLGTALQALARLGLVALPGKEVEKCLDERFIPARLRCSSKGFCFALREDQGDDIYIRDQHLNHAWNGDRVLVMIHREEGRRRSAEGIVQCILERQSTSVLAQLNARDEGDLAVPLDDQLLATIELEGGHEGSDQPVSGGNVTADVVMEVQVDRYPIGQFPARGHVVRRLSLAQGAGAYCDVLLTKHNLHARASAPRTTLRNPPERDREDLTDQVPLLLGEWQGRDAPCLPAVWLERKGDISCLWVHATAVAERTTFNSSLDQWMRTSGESLCLGEHWHPLLNAALAKDCTLQPGGQQRALSVRLELDPQGDLQSYRFCRSLIRPGALIDGGALQALRGRKSRSRAVPAALKPIKSHIKLLQELLDLSEQLRRRRLTMGSVDLSLEVPGIEGLGDLLYPFPDGAQQAWMPGNGMRGPLAMLAELIQPANAALGRHLKALGLPAVYASQTAPQESDINNVAKAAIALDLPVELDEEGNAPSLATLADIFSRSERSQVLQQQLAAALAPVVLSATPAELRLAGETEAFAPWCCPGLHYADVFNQHVLATLLGEGKNRPSVRHKTQVDLGSADSPAAIGWPVLTPSLLTPLHQVVHTSLIPRLNARRRQSRDLRRDLIQMAQARKAKPMLGETHPGRISGVQSYGFFVEIPPSQCEGLVHVSSLKDDWYEYHSRQSRLVGRKNRRAYKLGDKVNVTVDKVDVLRNQIDLSIPGLHQDEPAAASEQKTAALPVALADA